MTCTLISWRLVRSITTAGAFAAIYCCGFAASADEPKPGDTFVALQPGDDDPRPRRERAGEGDRRPEDRGPRDRGPEARERGDRDERGPRDRGPEARDREDRRPEERGPEGRGYGGFGGGFGRGGFEFRGPPEGRGPMGGPGPGMRGRGGPGNIDARLNQLERKLDEVLREVRDLRRQGPPRPTMGMRGGGGGGGGFGMPGGPAAFGRRPGGDFGPPMRRPEGFGPRRPELPDARPGRGGSSRDDDRNEDRDDDNRPRGERRPSGSDDLSF